ncbi:ABC transporter permease subunit [Phenylobacterium sp. LjRoot225]|uniref:ABC transporter permease n=1 Tax=Phenylobacterium sp. LjRoot225 TaxID=3342285 RepID=UPI003ECD4145
MSLLTLDRKAAPFSLPAFRWREARWLSPVALLLLWELGSRTGVIPPRILAAPSAVAETFLQMTVSGELPGNLAVSLARAATGLALGLLFGVTFALIAGLTRTGETAVDPLMQIKRTIPVVALTPLFIVWFGIGETAKVALIAVATVVPIYLNLFAGIRGVDPRLIEAGRSFGLSQRELIVHVILPGALPSFLVGLRYSTGIALLMLVVAEQINASAGLGHLINNARDFMRTDVIVVCLVVYAFLGLAGDLVVRALEARALAWRPSFVKS